MEAQSPFEIANKRLMERQRNRRFLFTWLGFLILSLIVLYFDGERTGGIVGPFAIFSGVMLANKLIQLRYTSPRQIASEKIIDQEMSWLYGENWQDFSEPQYLAFAQNRIRKRRVERWGFLLHAALFVGCSFFLITFASTFIEYHETIGYWFYPIPVVWLFFILRHALYSFPTAGMLSRREQAVGDALQREMQIIGGSMTKTKLKPKRGAVKLSDDGELIDTSEDSSTSRMETSRIDDRSNQSNGITQ